MGAEHNFHDPLAYTVRPPMTREQYWAQVDEPVSFATREDRTARDLAQKRGMPIMASVFESTNWRVNQACGGLESDRFYPEKDDDTAEDAKVVCAQCPIIMDCLEYAIKTREKFGVWGGTTPRERRRIIRQRREATA